MSASRTSNKILLSSAIALALVYPPYLGAAVADDTSLRFKTPAVCTTEGGSTVSVPPGRFLPERHWVALDIEFRDMEDRVTRLEAENKSLKATESDGPGWKLPTLALLVGIAIGAYTLGD